MRRLRQSYGLSLDQFHAMFEKQGERCALKMCGTVLAARGGRGANSAYVDHDHATKTIRGLLCVKCNAMLGMARDNPDLLREGAQYIEKHNALANAEVSPPRVV